MIGMAKHEYADIPIPTRNLVIKNNQNNYLYFHINKLKEKLNINTTNINKYYIHLKE